ncbi:hypothetical protein VCHA53O466_140083 [Vibrio chagasii]|nr:hypothetical protein VCHA53O466_140083 [Vibrio chagasii]
MPHIPKGCTYSNLKLVMRFDERSKISKGGIRNGKPYLNFSCNELIRNLSKEEVTFHEYKSIESKPIIGSFTGSPEKYMAALVAHELAHCIQHMARVQAKGGNRYYGFTESELRKGHGEAWQYIYRVLRKYAVNEMT